jgi:hypothetical protein
MRVFILVLVSLFFFMAAGKVSAASPSLLGITVSPSGVVMHGGRPYRGIGVNYFSAFYRVLQNPKDTSYNAGFAQLEAAHIPFCRMMGCGFWPVDQKLYQTDPHEFFRRFDAVVLSAQQHHIGLIPSLFWNEATVPDLVGEPVSAWADAHSRTRAYMRAYVRDVVGRYRNSPAIWGWEFGNEFNLSADLPNAAQHRPQIVPQLGTPKTRSAQDDVTYPDIRAAFAAFAQEVRRYNPNRFISTGDSFPRESAWHNAQDKTWTADTPAETAQMLQEDNSGPIDVISVHAYGDCTQDILTDAILARRWRKPLFVGEFGAPGPPSKSAASFQAILGAIQKANVPLAAVWVFDLPSQDDTFNVTPTNPRAYQLQMIGTANEQLHLIR